MKKLRRRIILVVFLSTAFVFAMTWIVVYFSLISYNTKQVDTMTQIISSHDGVVPRLEEFIGAVENIRNWVTFSEESAFRTRYFVVSFSNDMEAERADLGHIASIDEETAFVMAETVINTGETVGYLEEYRYRIAKNDEGKSIIIFVDCSESFALQRAIAAILAIIAISFTLLVTLVFSLFSNRVINLFLKIQKIRSSSLQTQAMNLRLLLLSFPPMPRCLRIRWEIMNGPVILLNRSVI